MDPLTLHEIAASCGGRLVQGAPEQEVRRVVIDSRQVQPGDLFVAIAGERFDGHDFATEAVRRGAAALLGERGKWGGRAGAGALILVEDSRRALAEVAAYHRLRFRLPVVAVGGSNGKTTNKELIAAALRARWNTLASEASFNNAIGVPLTLLQLGREHQAAVLEAGTNHPGELAPLVRMMAPQWGVITSIGREHLEFFGDLDGVCREEGSLAECLPAGGGLFTGAPAEITTKLARRTRARVVRVGWDGGCQWRAVQCRLADGGTVFTVAAPSRSYAGECRLRLLGRHQVVNALLALAVAAELGVRPEEARAGLAACLPPKHRLQLWTAGGVRVLDDCYNANADSMLAALETLRDLPGTGRRWAVLGDMAELGVHAPAMHREVGVAAARAGLAGLFVIGTHSGTLAAAATGAGLGHVVPCDSIEAVVTGVISEVTPGDVVLVKASRSARLERVVEALRERLTARSAAGLNGREGRPACCIT
ncbi:MAG: UDP-N-acetylmuramoyl-tripeptide--D-alanyl-D-alanine ligase [Verrucomicrobia bacterium]|nr:UDP-N-acetylmuramoyl-tripeptide--D-alanyl-D-alanine ligase [Verrucomicrobiota bacterium]